ncbi:hypothetical protein [Uliginosibacterium aquaticum]|uniref:Uncharacterized protein n=1 Tax=Uliginosibacterium aquaticum TaxID=2731212 RepID=A0ABX2IIM4_9RHOO|nr:hypothetical protein [Uliginosibacterium aquaticum]NSL56631.1 hypothetical protein [Uliginosibacterium aquaticum]
MNRVRPLLLSALLASLALFGTRPADAEPVATAESSTQENGIGRLFHSRQQRAILDELRRRNARIGEEQESDSITLQGIVRRSGGQSTVWINGRAHHDRAPVAALGERSASVFVGEGKTRELKVGERIQLVPAPEQIRP